MQNSCTSYLEHLNEEDQSIIIILWFLFYSVSKFNISLSSTCELHKNDMKLAFHLKNIIIKPIHVLLQSYSHIIITYLLYRRSYSITYSISRSTNIIYNNQFSALNIETYLQMDFYTLVSLWLIDVHKIWF